MKEHISFEMLNFGIICSLLMLPLNDFINFLIKLYNNNNDNDGNNNIRGLQHIYTEQGWPRYFFQ